MLKGSPHISVGTARACKCAVVWSGGPTCAHAVLSAGQSEPHLTGAVGGALQVDAPGRSHKVREGGTRGDGSQGGWHDNGAVSLPSR